MGVAYSFYTFARVSFFRVRIYLYISMCLFPIPNKNFNSPSYLAGVKEFACGCCPECLSKKSRFWALRAYYESLEGPCCMITLTYDSYIYDSRYKNKIVGERVASDMVVNVSDCQKFIKRLRKHYSDRPIKYIICPEYGKKTHRPHYHALLFGVDFSEDRVPHYKKSKRGNVIYHSDLLSRIWKNGICTVDSVNITASVARYCTKYMAKQRGSVEMPMLFSRGIGERGLLSSFNGYSYVVEGLNYPIPRTIWQKEISSLYGVDFRYYSPHGKDFNKYLFHRKARVYARLVRDNHIPYQNYLNYWKNLASSLLLSQKSIFERILALDDNKFFSYKQKALEYYPMYIDYISKSTLYPLLPCPGSSIKKIDNYINRCDYVAYLNFVSSARELDKKSRLPLSSRHITANDTFLLKYGFNRLYFQYFNFLELEKFNFLRKKPKFFQLSIDI